MSIADKITSIEGHLTADYEGLENIGADLTNVNKNIQNIRTCLDNIYSSLPKTTGEGSNLSLTTLKGRINVDDILGDTQQDTTNGYQLLDLTLAKLKTYNTSGTWNNNVYTISGLTITINDDMSIKVNGTATAQVGLLLAGGAIPYPTGTYYLSGASNGSNTTYDVRIFNYDGTSAGAQCFTGTKQVAIVNNSQSYNMALVVRNGVTCNNTMFYPMLSTTNTSDYEPYTNGASPNPTYPQPISVATGTQEVFLSNKPIHYKDFKDLPNTYQAVEYIESTGEQYIDTLVKPNTNTKIDIEFITIQKGTYGTIFGGEDAYNSNAFHLYNSSSNFDIGFGTRYSAETIPYSLNTNYKFEMDKTGFKLNEVSSLPFNDNTITTNNSIFLFAVNRGTSRVIDSNAQKRIYYCKLYDNGTLVRNLIPCYRKSDNIIGMYDLVNNVFYTNVGTGTFTKGNDLQSQTKTLHLGDIELAKIGTYQDRIFETSGKNKFDKDNVESGKYYNINGVILTSSNWNIAQIEVQPNTNYYLSGNNYNNETAGIVLLDESKNFISLVSSYKNVHLITTTATTKYIGLSIANYSGSSDMNSIMLNEGSTALPYEPYGSDKWYIEKNIGHKKASEITENDIGGVGGSQSVYFTSSFTNVIANRTLQVYSNVQTWKNTTDTEWNTLNGNYIGVLFNVQQIYINKTASTKSELITWLNSINFEMYYVLSTPTYEEITNTTLLNELNEIEKMMSYNGTTNISVSGNLPMILDVTALKGE